MYEDYLMINFFEFYIKVVEDCSLIEVQVYFEWFVFQLESCCVVLLSIVVDFGGLIDVFNYSVKLFIFLWRWVCYLVVVKRLL